MSLNETQIWVWFMPIFAILTWKLFSNTDQHILWIIKSYAFDTDFN